MTTTIIPSFSKISQNYDLILCDVWGVLHNGVRAFLHAAEALMQARSHGATVILITNAPKTGQMVQKLLDHLGIPQTAYDAIISAGDAMQYSLFQNYHGQSSAQKIYFIGSALDRDILTNLPSHISAKFLETTPDAAESIICAGPDYGIKDTPQDYEIDLRIALNRKLPLYCANPDITVEHGDKVIYCGGAIAQFYEEMGGVVYQFGKPLPEIYQYALLRAEAIRQEVIGSDRILAIGDGIRTDVKGAMLEGYDMLFISSGLAARETHTGLNYEDQPNHIQLDDYLNTHQLSARYAMGHLHW